MNQPFLETLASCYRRLWCLRKPNPSCPHSSSVQFLDVQQSKLAPFEHHSNRLLPVRIIDTAFLSLNMFVELAERCPCRYASFSFNGNKEEWIGANKSKVPVSVGSVWRGRALAYQNLSSKTNACLRRRCGPTLRSTNGSFPFRFPAAKVANTPSSKFAPVERHLVVNIRIIVTCGHCVE